MPAPKSKIIVLTHKSFPENRMALLEFLFIQIRKIIMRFRLISSWNNPNCPI